MKYLITETQYKKLLIEQEISIGGFVKINNPNKKGILAPDGSIKIVDSGTTIVNLNEKGKGSWEDYSALRNLVGTDLEGWIPKNQKDIEAMHGLNLGKGPTVGVYDEPNKGRFFATYINSVWINENDKPRPDMWRFNGWEIGNSPKKEIEKEKEKNKGKGETGTQNDVEDTWYISQ